MTDAARDWLARRTGHAPPSLQQRMAQALTDAEDSGALPDVLAAAALVCLEEALESCDERRAALPLLAADALVTAACEAAVDAGPDEQGAAAALRALDALCASLSPARLAPRVPPA